MSAPGHTTSRVAEQATGLDLRLAAEVLSDAAAKAGAAIMAHYGALAEVEFKDDSSPVTKADRDADAILLAALSALAPSIPVVSEETASDRMAPLGQSFFLVDPLDGTKEFIKKRTDFTVNVALIENRFPRFGLVYAPARALLTVTPADGVAIEAEMAPDAKGADLNALDHKRLHARAQTRPADSPPWSAHLISTQKKPEDFLTGFNVAKRSRRGLLVQVHRNRKGQRGPLSTPRADHGVGHGGRPSGAGGRWRTCRGHERRALRYGKTGMPD